MSNWFNRQSYDWSKSWSKIRSGSKISWDREAKIIRRKPSNNNAGFISVVARSYKNKDAGIFRLQNTFDAAFEPDLGGGVVVIEPGIEPGQEHWTASSGSFSWTVPAGVTFISAVAVAGGGGGGGANSGNIGPQGGSGGGLSYQNDIAVTPGETLTIVVGAAGPGGNIGQSGTNGGDSEIKRGSTVLLEARGGVGGRRQSSGDQPGGFGGSSLGYDGGGDGGRGGDGANNSAGGGGGGAAGYSGNGGSGGYSNSNTGQTGGSGGGGGGGEADSVGSGGGGGVGVYGEGSSGGATGDLNSSSGTGGFGGSGGANGSIHSGGSGQGDGGNFGGGGGTDEDDSVAVGGTGGRGAVRIIWGTGRAYPSTNTADV